MNSRRQLRIMDILLKKKKKKKRTFKDGPPVDKMVKNDDSERSFIVTK